jgi:hypothetical protein
VLTHGLLTPDPQLLGLDYLVDCDLVPWLLEVNGTPSLVRIMIAA